MQEPPVTVEKVMRIEHISKVYGKRIKALDDINLTIPLGRIFGILGPNGSGKSTLLRLIANIDRQTSGKIIIRGKEILQNPTWIRKYFGYCPQDPVFYSHLTVRENLVLLAELHNLQPEIYRPAIQHMLDDLDLSPKENELAKDLSGGQKQRLSLIQSLIHAPKILLLDEPTTGLDVHSRSLIQKYLKSMSEQGLTVILSSHDLSEMEDLCDQVAILAEGRVIANAMPAELIKECVQVQYIVEIIGKGEMVSFLKICCASDKIECLEKNQNLSTNSFKITLGIKGDWETAIKLQEIVKNSGTEVSQILLHKSSLEDAYRILLLNYIKDHQKNEEERNQ